MANYAVLVVIGAALLLVGSLAAGIYLIRSSRKRAAAGGPACGHCGYNLTGAPGNRCPECGRLFIEAGVLAARTTGSRPRRTIGILACVTALVLLTVLFLGNTLAHRAAVARQAAVAAQQAAMRQQAVAVRRAALDAVATAVEAAIRDRADANDDGP